MQFLSLGTGAIVGIAIGGAALLLIAVMFWYFTTKNMLVSIRNDVEESYSTMDVYMKKRYDLIPNLVATVKGYAKHESETFERVVQARNNAANATGAAKPAAEAELNSALKVMINAVHETYPELKADSQFNNLSEQLASLEYEIGNSRKYYNAKVRIFNTKIEQFPSSIVAGRMGLQRMPYFELTDVSERTAPQVTF